MLRFDLHGNPLDAPPSRPEKLAKPAKAAVATAHDVKRAVDPGHSRMAALEARQDQMQEQLLALKAAFETLAREIAKLRQGETSKAKVETKKSQSQSHDAEPWKAAGVSKATYYRQQKAKAK